MIKKIYIAGKITGLDNYKELFSKAERMLEDLGYSVMNPSVLNSGFLHEEYMKVCYSMIDVCDSVYFLSNFGDSKGALMEMDYALAKYKTIVFEKTFIPLIEGKV